MKVIHSKLNILNKNNMFDFRAILSANGKEHFLKQLELIVDSVQQNRFKIERRQQEEKSKRDILNVQLTQLIEKARQYAKVLKDFQEVNFKKRIFFIYLFIYFKFEYFRLYEKMKIFRQNPNKIKDIELILYK